MSQSKRPCQAQTCKRKGPTCGEPTDGNRFIHAAPGVWIQIPLCHFHQHVWDEGRDWSGPQLFRKTPCTLEHEWMKKGELFEVRSVELSESQKKKLISKTIKNLGDHIR